MKAAVVLLPGLNRDRDMIAAITKISGQAPITVWQTDTSIPDDVDLILIPGGFSYGDYLRCGAIAARMPVMQAIREKADKGVMVIGVCNGFQILVEAGMLPCADAQHVAEVRLPRSEARSQQCEYLVHTRLSAGQIIRCPVAHHDGNYFADAETLKRVEGEGQVVFRYADSTNPNGSVNDIAGIVNARGNVLGMMPHPENLIEGAHGGDDGRALLQAHWVSQLKALKLDQAD